MSTLDTPDSTTATKQSKTDPTQPHIEYYAALQKVLSHVVLVDNVIEDAEVETIREIYSELTGKQVSAETILDEIRETEDTETDLSKFLAETQNALSEAEKEKIIQAALSVALADGSFHEEEKALIGEIGRDLGMTDVHITSLVTRMQQQ